jgi:hypothetical protein
MIFVVVLAVSPMLFVVPLFVWARWLRRAAKAPRYVAKVAYVLISIALVAVISGSVGAARVFRGATVCVESGAASEMARLIGQGVSRALNCGALAVLAAILAAGWLLYGTWRWHWAGRRAG